MTGEEEDTDVGFPGPGHFIAEREVPMKVAMSGLAVLAIVGGALQIPGVDDAVTRFLAPTFADSRLAHVHVSNGPSWLGLAIGALIAVAGIYTAYRIWVRDPAIAVNARERFQRVYLLLSNKWYFDELIDVVIVRPTLWLGGVITSVLERGLIQGLITGGPVAVVRAGSAAVRRSETGFVRYYAAAMVIFTLGVALYFLVSSS
jgi:NADH-quinone oxidoreductase subunit L